MVSERHRARALLGVVAGVLVAASATVVLATGGSAATGIAITSGPCSNGGTSFCFTPEIATAETGMPVTWTDTSGVAHEIAQCTPSACPGSPASTGINTFDVAVPADGHGSFTFSTAGTYYYYCSIHGYVAMHGTIVVATPATPPPVPSATSAANGAADARSGHAVRDCSSNCESRTRRLPRTQRPPQQRRRVPPPRPRICPRSAAPHQLPRRHHTPSSRLSVRVGVRRCRSLS